MNKDYKRLTKRNYFEGDYSVVPEELSKEITKWKEQHATEITAPPVWYHLGERLCQLEDKIENGTLIELPCKVGDTFYGIQDEGCFAYCCYGFKYGWRRGEDDECYVLYALTIYEIEFVWGEEAFATEAEAEAKLRELKGDRE